LPRKTFSDGDALPASDLNTYLMDQSVQTYSSATDRTADLPTPADGQVTSLATNKNLEIYYGAYRPLPFAMEVKEVSITGNGATTRSIAFTFISGRFTQTPICLTSPENSQYTSSASIISSTGLTINIRNVLGNTFTATIPVRYLAIQMTNGTAAG
jgi:hypothetical protein